MSTFTNDEAKAIFTRVMDRMVQAGWLHSHTFTEGKGFHLNWTEAGAQRARLLHSIATAFRLNGHDYRPTVAFDKLAHGEHLPDYARSFELDPKVAALWRQSVEELSLHGDADGLLGMVHVVLSWAPDADTPIVFDPEA